MLFHDLVQRVIEVDHGIVSFRQYDLLAFMDF
jgi:hypothetical protein